MENVWKKVKKWYNFRHCVICFLIAWCLICILEMLVAKQKRGLLFTTLEYVGHVSVAGQLVLVVFVYVALLILLELLQKENPKWADRAEKIGLLLSTFLYAVICVVQKQDTLFGIGMAALLLFSVLYALRNCKQEFFVSKPVLYGTYVLCGLFFVAFTGGATVCRYFAYEAPNYDLGLFSQMFHYMKTTFTMNTTLERDRLLSHFAVHISPAFYWLLPFYMFIPSPATLQIMQAVVIALGLVPLAGICRNHNCSNLTTMLFGVAYVFYPVMSGDCFYDIHENLFLPLFLLCLIYFYEKDSWKGIIISLVLLLGVKEDAAIYAVFVSLFMLFERKNWKKCVTTIGISLVYFVFTTLLLAKIGDGVMSYRYNNMIYGGNGSMLGIIRTVFVNPAYIMTQMFTMDKVEFILQTLGALCFLPLFSKRWYRLVLFGPYVLFCLMSDYPYFHDIYFQYVFGSGTLLFYLALLNVMDCSEKIKICAVPVLAITCLLVFLSTVYTRAAVFERYTDAYNRQIYASMQEAIQTIPKEASVTATTFLCPALSDRDEVYELYYTDKKTEYVILDLRTATTEYNVQDYLQNPEFETVYYKEMEVGVFRRKNF